MRSADQISRTVGEWHDFQKAQREKASRDLRAEIARARARGDEWLTWIEARARREHQHDLRDDAGAVIDCPVPGCNFHRGTPNPHRVTSVRGRAPSRRDATA